MAARIEVARGPDAGWRFLVVGGEARVGRGAGCQVRVTDPAWPDGHLRVQHRQGGYLVTNQLPYPVLLDDQPLAPGDHRTWYAGSYLQPTAATLLTLSAAEAPAGPPPDGGVVAEPPGRKAGATPVQWAVAGVLVVACAVMLNPFGGEPASAAPSVARHEKVRAKLAEAERAPRVGPDVARLREALNVAMLRESNRRRSAAYKKYTEARDLIVAVRRADPDADTLAALAEAEAHVHARMDALAPR